MAKLSKKDWVAAEEMYREGATQKEIAAKFGVRPETVSAHMAKARITPGEKMDRVRQELRNALDKKLKHWAQAKADRQIDFKEQILASDKILLNLFMRQVRDAAGQPNAFQVIAGATKAFREAMAGLKIAREEMWAILEIREDFSEDELPDLAMSTLTEEEEEALRAAKASSFDDDLDADLNVAVGGAPEGAAEDEDGIEEEGA